METQDVISINTILPNNQMTIMFFLSILFYMTTNMKDGKLSFYPFPAFIFFLL